MDVITDRKSLQYVFTQNELNLRKTRWFELFKDYDMSVLYPAPLGKANVVADSLSCMTMGSVSHVEEGKKDLVKMFVGYVDRVFVYKILQKNGFVVHYNSKSSLVVEVKSKQHLDP